MRFTIPHFTRRQILLWLGMPVIGLLIGGGIVWYLNLLRPHILPEIVEVANFQIYYPKQLPNHYTLKNDSFKYSSKEGTLIFEASDKAGDRLVFTEVKPPKDFNYSKFYEQQLSDSKPLENTPFPSRVGKAFDKKTTLMSIIADGTWIMVSTTADVSNQDMYSVAQSISKY
jgi:hypothetical protein